MNASVAFATAVFLLSIYSQRRIKNEIACFDTFSVRQIVHKHIHAYTVHGGRRTGEMAIHLLLRCAALYYKIRYYSRLVAMLFILCNKFKLINMELMVLLLLDLRMSWTLPSSVQRVKSIDSIHKIQLSILKTTNNESLAFRFQKKINCISNVNVNLSVCECSWFKDSC